MSQEIILRPFQKNELPLFVNWVNNDEIMGKHLQVQNFCLSDVEDEFSQNQWQSAALTRLLVCQQDGTVIGFVHWWKVEPLEPHIVEFGIILLPQYHNQGYGTHAMAITIDRLFQYDNIYRAQAITSVHNKAMLRICQNLNIVIEGMLRKYMVVGNEKVDCMIGSILRDSR